MKFKDYETNKRGFNPEKLLNVKENAKPPAVKFQDKQDI